jgi:3-oxoacyl-[acyl-carrier protein] reductase
MKCALVTGGSRGIGRAICIELAAMRFHLLINFRSNLAEGQETLTRIQKNGGTGELLPCDISRPEEVERVIGGWVETNEDRSVDVLVNNAGISRDALMMWMKHDEWSEVIDTNLNSFCVVTRLLLKGMLTRKRGRIINIVSLSGQKGHQGQVNYSAAKAGLIGATKALAQEVGKRNITVNAVAPGLIMTDMTQDMASSDIKRLIPLQRFGTSEEVAAVVGFLASERSSYITGDVISVNGGLYT